MNRVLVSVEGQTEETFIREILREYLWAYNVDVQAVILSTKRTKQGNKFKGGITSYRQANQEISRLLNDTNAVAVSTMYDLYGLPNDFPAKETSLPQKGVDKALYLEGVFQEKINNPRFHPYLQVHEFEALLFVSPDTTAQALSIPNLSADLLRIRQNFPTPEDINDNPQTAPSKRLLALYPEYKKPLDGALAIKEIGLDSIREECLHFHNWIEWLESLGGLK